MKHTLVGYTGFVGGNLASSHTFDNLYNSANIQEGFAADNGLVVYSGMYSEKFLANADPAADFARAQNAMENIRRLRPEKLVLISTVDVYPKPFSVYEDKHIHSGKDDPAYGKNRLALEEWVHEEYPDALILRLPALYGKGLKKNFIFDMLHPAPSTLTAEKYAQLCAKSPLIEASYKQDDTGFYRLSTLAPDAAAALTAFFKQNDFNALQFTDSRSVFQFYNLENLWHDIEFCLKRKLRLVNLATEPVEAGTLYELLFGEEFVNHLPKGAVWYDIRTRYGRDFGGLDDYISDRAEVVAGIAKFVSEQL